MTAKTVATVNILSTDYGDFICPPDLLKLGDKAPKVRGAPHPFADDDAIGPTIPDITTSAGSAYYAREREILSAINIVFGTGVLAVVNVKDGA